MGRKLHKRPGKRLKAKRITKQLDEIFEDAKEENRKKLENQAVDYDIPGNAQFYCVECAKYYISEKALDDHKKSRPHRRKLKQLETEKPYTIEESERAGNMGSYR